MKRLLTKLLILFMMVLATDLAVGGLLERGLRRYYGMDKPAQVLCVGHSRTQLGISSELLERGLGVPVAKYALGGTNIFDRLTMIRHYFSEQPSSVNAVVYDVDQFSFQGKGLGINQHMNFYPFMNNPVVDSYLREHAGTLTEYVTRKYVRLLRYGDSKSIALRGVISRLPDKAFLGSVDVDALKRQLAAGSSADKIRFDDDNIRVFEETMRFVLSRGSKLVLVYIPIIDLVNDRDRHGQRRAVQLFEQYARDNNGVIFLNYNGKYEHSHKLFNDSYHMNGKGQQRITDDLVKDLRAIL